MAKVFTTGPLLQQKFKYNGLKKKKMSRKIFSLRLGFVTADFVIIEVHCNNNYNNSKIMSDQFSLSDHLRKYTSWVCEKHWI